MKAYRSDELTKENMTRHTIALLKKEDKLNVTGGFSLVVTLIA